MITSEGEGLALDMVDEFGHRGTDLPSFQRLKWTGDEDVYKVDVSGEVMRRVDSSRWCMQSAFAQARCGAVVVGEKI